MAKRVTFVPRTVAETMVPTRDTVLISITHPGDMADVDHWAPLLFSFYFDDIVIPISGHKMFDVAMADHLLDCVSISDGLDIIVHCEAGMSRSAAVAKWLSERRDYELWMHPDGIGTADHYNRHVYKTLDAADGKDMASYYAEIDRNERAMQ